MPVVWTEDDCTRGLLVHESASEAFKKLTGRPLVLSIWTRVDRSDCLEFSCGEYVVRSVYGAYYEIEHKPFACLEAMSKELYVK